MCAYDHITTAQAEALGVQLAPMSRYLHCLVDLLEKEVRVDPADLLPQDARGASSEYSPTLITIGRRCRNTLELICVCGLGGWAAAAGR